ncbi:hypothetical protein [Bradyrhizobium sp. AUGA SZCCT0431]|uniref:hypothetical protein n=1 Tax=Bradyrhizobium sp. AUGA SZCCT0431 TaxID=2807674 RepID=UPI001BAE440F|nr:hypothetical protein [Bradyrhizobium sp. AUGA SZCCT0431]MBR1142554.1 hypothetical protein [Bradyrhizobium sp. AUGA SZCCT0431]
MGHASSTTKIGEPIRAVLPRGAGVAVLIRKPERCAIHKLIVGSPPEGGSRRNRKEFEGPASCTINRRSDDREPAACRSRLCSYGSLGPRRSLEGVDPHKHRDLLKTSIARSKKLSRLLESSITACRRVLSQEEPNELVEHLRAALREIEALPPVEQAPGVSCGCIPAIRMIG